MSELLCTSGHFMKYAGRLGRRLTVLAFPAVLMSMAGCGGDDPPSVPGTYELTEADGDALPATVNDFVITDGTLSLSADDDWTLSIQIEGVTGGLQDAGTYTSSDGDIEFTSTTFPDDGAPTGNLDGETLDMEYDFNGDGDVETTFTFTRR